MGILKLKKKLRIDNTTIVQKTNRNQKTSVQVGEDNGYVNTNTCKMGIIIPPIPNSKIHFKTAVINYVKVLYDTPQTYHHIYTILLIVFIFSTWFFF